jgi:hypothetical protein
MYLYLRSLNIEKSQIVQLMVYAVRLYTQLPPLGGIYIFLNTLSAFTAALNNVWRTGNSVIPHIKNSIRTVMITDRTVGYAFIFLQPAQD